MYDSKWYIKSLWSDIMKTYTKEEVLQQFELSCDIIYRADETGDYKTCNKEGAKLIKIFKYFEKNTEFAMECIKEMLHNESVVISNYAAAYCLALNENVDDAVNVLTTNSEKKEWGIFRLEAEMTLNVWKSQGYLCLYKDQEIRRHGPGDGLPFIRK